MIRRIIFAVLFMDHNFITVLSSRSDKSVIIIVTKESIVRDEEGFTSQWFIFLFIL